MFLWYTGSWHIRWSHLSDWYATHVLVFHLASDKLSILISDHVDYVISRYRSCMCSLYDYRGPQISYDTAHDQHRCIHSNTEAYTHGHAAAAFDKQCRSLAMIRSFDHVTGQPVGHRTPLCPSPSSPLNNTTHLFHCHCGHWHNFIGGLLLLVWSSGSLHLLEVLFRVKTLGDPGNIVLGKGTDPPQRGGQEEGNFAYRTTQE